MSQYCINTFNFFTSGLIRRIMKSVVLQLFMQAPKKKVEKRYGKFFNLFPLMCKRWFLGEDFNDLLEASDKRGGIPISN